MLLFTVPKLSDCAQMTRKAGSQGGTELSESQFMFFFSEEAELCTVCQAKFSTRGGFTANLRLRHRHRTVQLTQIRGFSLFLLKITAESALLQPAPPALFQILLLHQEQHQG